MQKQIGGIMSRKIDKRVHVRIKKKLTKLRELISQLKATLAMKRTRLHCGATMEDTMVIVVYDTSIRKVCTGSTSSMNCEKCSARKS